MFSFLRKLVIARAVAVLAAVAVPLAHALELGSLSLAHFPAMPMSSVTFSRAPIAFTSFARAVGGVAFTTVATSTDGTVITGLRHDASAADGSRLRIDVRKPDGTLASYTPTVPDWILVPLARLVASDASGAVTLFGALKDENKQLELQRDNKAMIANYHPALENTLLGLRLLQADMMAFEPNATDLFRERGQYILGSGERAPTDADLKANMDRFGRVQTWVDSQPDRYASYVTGDVLSQVRFWIGEDRLRFSGEPTWYCWRHDHARVDAVVAAQAQALSPDALVLFSISRMEQRAEVEFDRLSRPGSPEAALSASSRKARAETMALRSIARSILAQPAQAGGGPTLLRRQALAAALNSGDDTALEGVLAGAIERLESLKSRDPQLLRRLQDELAAVGPKIAAAIDAVPVVQMATYSEAFSRVIATERGINPTVYKTLQTAVRIAALMRAAKQTDPARYGLFVASIAAVPTRVDQPVGYALRTPTVYPRSSR